MQKWPKIEQEFYHIYSNYGIYYSIISIWHNNRNMLSSIKCAKQIQLEWSRTRLRWAVVTTHINHIYVSCIFCSFLIFYSGCVIWYSIPLLTIYVSYYMILNTTINQIYLYLLYSGCVICLVYYIEVNRIKVSNW